MNMLVVILDGLSFIISNTFLFLRENIGKLLHLPNSFRGMCYVDVIPYTPHVLNSIFTLSTLRKIEGKLTYTRYVWEIEGVNVRVINLPISIPPKYHNISLPIEWYNFYTPPKERFEHWVNIFHRYVLANGNYENLIVWYPIPDQAHHHFFPAIPDIETFNLMLDWYDKSCKIALDLLDKFKPRRWLIMGDHGLVSDIEEFKGIPIHHRETLAITNFDKPPKKISNTIFWIHKALTSKP